ncbi:GNAT family N-acetyltransferase [Gorillibacterium sp. sgz500922]|uniref:GNAT family N-acetyltransferase n=1 Tax=Gorillibacterium sp. sgz500922 TaxID=3446694 RepID=UPI003F66E638
MGKGQSFSDQGPETIAEPGIATLEGYRRQGYARVVCAAYLKHVVKNGLVPIWTCENGNVASARLAISLGFVKLCDLFSVEGAGK